MGRKTRVNPEQDRTKFDSLSYLEYQGLKESEMFWNIATNLLIFQVPRPHSVHPVDEAHYARRLDVVLEACMGKLQRDDIEKTLLVRVVVVALPVLLMTS